MTEERKRAEALAELDRAKTTFFSNVSHELRTPLTLLLGPLEEIATKPEVAEQAESRALLTVAQRNGQRLLKLVNTLLDFSRLEAGRTQASYEPVDLAAYTAELASGFRSAIEKAGMRLIIDCPPLPEPVFVDRDMWEKIVLNLISNAFKYTLEGEIRVSVRAANGTATLSVQDTGVGIPAAELPNLFKRFHRVEGVQSRTHEGTGIGLALVQELAKLHGGNVEVASVFGKGSTFTITLPLGHAHLPAEHLGGERTLASTAVGLTPFLEESLHWLPDAHQVNGAANGAVASSTAPPSLSAPQPHRDGAPKNRIVLADDNADMRAYIQRLLRPEYEVVAVTDGQEALRVIAEKRPDLVLTDVMMPNLDGFGLLKALRENTRTAELPVIMLSARAGEEARVEGLHSGADDYLIKPFSARELLARVKGTLSLTQVRRQAAEAVRIGEERLQQATETGKLGLWDWDITTNHLVWTESLYAIHGVNPKTFQATVQGFTELVYPADRERVAQAIQAALATDAPYELEFRALRPDGEIIWLFTNAKVLRAEGRPVRLLGATMDITQRKRTELALRESEERFAKAFNASPFVVTISSLKTGKLVEVNETFVHLSGYTREEAIGRTTAELGVWARPQEREAELQTVQEQGQVRNAEYRFRTRTGEELVGILSAECIEVGGEPCALTVIADITERKRAEDLLLINQERERARSEELEALMNAVPAIVWFAHDPACKVIKGNRAANEMLRLPANANQSLSAPAEEKPQHFKVFKDGRELPASELPVQLAAQGLEVRDFEEEVVFANGERRSLYGHAVPLHDNRGQVRGAISAFVDITERKQAEEERERRYRDGLKLTETNRALVGAFELAEVTAIICHAARALTGAQGASFVLREGEQVHYVDEDSIAPLWKGQSFPLDCCISGWAIREEKQVALEDIYQDDRIPHDAYSSTFVRSLVMTPVGPSMPVASIGVYWDRTHCASVYELELLQSLASAADLALASVRAYGEARRARVQAEDANRLKDDFLATVSHELRTPLNGILGWAKMLRAGKLSAEKAQQALETIERNARSQNGLIEDLLDVSRIISGKMRLDLHPVDLVAIIEAALNVVRPTAGAKGVGLYPVLPTRNVMVIGDAERLQQIVWNLLSNAIKFTPRDGSVLVQLEQLDSQLEITIADTGAGIKPEFLPFVFDRFRQADSSITRPHGGLGLGLAIVRHLTELHGGTVSVQSPGEGQGATFTIHLPLGGAPPEHSQTEPLRPSAAIDLPADYGIRLEGIRVLVVDDEPDARDLLLSLLSGSGAAVVTVESSAEGMVALAETQFDVIVSDIEMPGEDGYSFMIQVRDLEAQRGRSTPAIALTAHARTADRVRALAAGYQNHVPKPVEPAELVAVIASLHRQYNR